MAFVKCTECGNEYAENLSQCPKCGCINAEKTNSTNVKLDAKISSLRNFRILLVTLTLICVVVSGIFFYKAYDVKNNYYNSEYSSSLTNAYVGGDAYNYIINGTYFNGYSTIASSNMVCAVILLCGSILLTIKINEYE